MSTSGGESGGNNSTAEVNAVSKGRYERIKVDLEKAIDRYLGSLNKNKEFFKNFEAISKENPEFLTNIVGQLKSQLKDYILCESENIFEEEKLEDKLNILDAIVSESKNERNYEAWRPSGDAQLDLKDHAYKTRQRHNEALKMYLQTLKQNNDQLSLSLNETNQENLRKFELLRGKLEVAKSTVQI